MRFKTFKIENHFLIKLMVLIFSFYIFVQFNLYFMKTIYYSKSEGVPKYFIQIVDPNILHFIV